MSQVWGTGYGAKRHLPDQNGIQPSRFSTSMRQAQAACSPTTIFLTAFSDDESEVDRKFVMAKAACTRCAKQADLKICLTCSGTGTVST